jgi:hypothetical protein
MVGDHSQKAQVITFVDFDFQFHGCLLSLCRFPNWFWSWMRFWGQVQCLPALRPNAGKVDGEFFDRGVERGL